MAFAQNFIKMEIGFSLRGQKIVILSKFIVVCTYDMWLQRNFSCIIGFLAEVKDLNFPFNTKQKSVHILLWVLYEKHMIEFCFVCLFHSVNYLKKERKIYLKPSDIVWLCVLEEGNKHMWLYNILDNYQYLRLVFP